MVALLKSGKVDFRANKIITGGGTLQNDKNVNPLRRYGIPKFVFTYALFKTVLFNFHVFVELSDTFLLFLLAW